MTAPFTLSVAAVDVLWADLRLGVPAYPFDIPHNGVTSDEYTAIRVAVLDDLARQGLARAGRVDPRVEAALAALARPDTSVSAIGLVAGRALLALAATTRERTVLAVQDEQHLSFDHPRPTGLVDALLGVLPEVRSGVGQSVTIFDGAGARAGKAATRSYLERPRTAFGRLSVSGPQVAPFELNWFDTDRGRYICYRNSGRDGANWITYAPADKRRMAHLLSEALATRTP